MQGAFRPAVNDGVYMAAALIGGGDQDVRVPRVQYHIPHSRVFANRQGFGPRLAAVRRLEEPAIAARSPQRPFCRDVDRVGVARIDDDFADMFRILQTNILPRSPAVDRLINAIPVSDTALAVVLARTDPNHVRILRIEYHAADGIRPFVVEYWRPGNASVRRFPDSA